MNPDSKISYLRADARIFTVKIISNIKMFSSLLPDNENNSNSCFLLLIINPYTIYLQKNKMFKNIADLQITFLIPDLKNYNLLYLRVTNILLKVSATQSFCVFCICAFPCIYFKIFLETNKPFMFSFYCVIFLGNSMEIKYATSTNKTCAKKIRK